MRRHVGTAVAVMAVGLLVSCSGPSGSDSGGAGSDAGGGVVAAPEAPPDPEVAPTVPGEADPDRQVVQTASVTMTVEDPADGARRVSVLVESVGGRVDERTEQAASGDDAGTADLVVRVPANQLTDVLADLEDVGEVDTVSVSRSDVTATAVDLDARISALRTSVARLQGLMDDAATTEALLAAESALADRQEKLESLQSQRALLADQVELSTVTVHLAPFGVSPAGGPDGFLDGLGTGWRSLVSALGSAVVVLGVVLPWLVLAALITAAVLVPARLVRRRRTAAVAGPAPEPPARV